MSDAFRLHEIQLMKPYHIDSMTQFQLYLDEALAPSMLANTPGWIGQHKIGHDDEVRRRPFVMTETGEIDFGEFAPEAERYGIIHWARLNEVSVGAEIEVTIGNSAETYTVMRVSRL